MLSCAPTKSTLYLHVPQVIVGVFPAFYVKLVSVLTWALAFPALSIRPRPAVLVSYLLHLDDLAIAL